MVLNAYHFLPEDFRSDEDMIAGVDHPWQLRETRAYTPVVVGGDQPITQRGYHSSPTPWEAFIHADGPILCLVEVSKPISIERFAGARRYVSERRRLLKARNLERELRLFARLCARHVCHLYGRRVRDDSRLLQALETAHLYAQGSVSDVDLASALSAARDAAGSTRQPARAAAWAATATAFPDAVHAALSAMCCAEVAARKGRLGARQEREWQRRTFQRTVGYVFG